MNFSNLLVQQVSESFRRHAISLKCLYWYARCKFYKTQFVSYRTTQAVLAWPKLLLQQILYTVVLPVKNSSQT